MTGSDVSPGAPDRDDEVKWYFQAMEYYALILNRTYTVMITERMLCGAFVHGVIAAPPIPTPDWRDPNFYVSSRVERYAGVHVESPAFKRRHRFNFQYPLSDLAGAEFDARPKWGMGSVPYSGRVRVYGKAGWRRELILVGSQPGPSIAERLQLEIQEAQPA